MAVTDDALQGCLFPDHGACRQCSLSDALQSGHWEFPPCPGYDVKLHPEGGWAGNGELALQGDVL